MLKKRLFFSTMSYSLNSSKQEQTPLFHLDINLTIPTIGLQPTLDEIQQTVNNVLQMFVQLFKNVSLWEIREKYAAASVTTGRVKSAISSSNNYYKLMADNKDIIKSITTLSTCINSMKEAVTLPIKSFNKFDKLWKSEREAAIQEFLESFPTVNEFKMEMKTYQLLQSQVAGMLLLSHIVLRTVLYSILYIQYSILYPTAVWRWKTVLVSVLSQTSNLYELHAS